MRKRLIGHQAKGTAPDDEKWLDLQSLALVEFTSEDPDCPVEAALVAAAETGWRAAAPGEQTIRLLFDVPRPLRRIQLLFEDDRESRTQEFVLRWSSDGGRSYRDIVRQQYTFSPDGGTRELEDYEVDLAGVTALELTVLPDIGAGQARASLLRWRLA